MVLTEALGFMTTFAISGAVFGLGFTWTQSDTKSMPTDADVGAD
jgi:hypothetical protein